MCMCVCICVCAHTPVSCILPPHPENHCMRSYFKVLSYIWTLGQLLASTKTQNHSSSSKLMRVPVQFPQYHLLQRLHLSQCVCFSVLEEKKLAMYMLTSGVSILFLSLCEPFNSIILSTDSSFCQLVLASCVTRPIFFFF